MFHTEMCECVAEFDSTQYTREQLQNTIDFLWFAPYIENHGLVWSIDEMYDLNSTKLKSECEERIKTLRKIDIVDDEFWQKLRNEQIAFYEGTCELKFYSIAAYTNPDTLLHYQLDDSLAIYYRDALIEGGDQMIEAWIKLNEAKKKMNASPESLQRKFDERYNSDSALDYARLEIMLFGWWNSANRLLPHINSSYHYFEEFGGLMESVSCECDEP